jgi:hypothetical protein
VANSIAGYLLAALFLAAMIALSNVPVRYILRGMRTIILLLAITMLFNLFLTPGDVLFRLGPLKGTKEGLIIPLPEKAKKLVAAVDWAGNTGKLIANLLFKPEAFGEAFTISSCQNLTWEQVAQYYEELIGAKFQWIDTDEYIRTHPDTLWSLIYDRLYDRPIDNSKVLRVTGLTDKDFTPMKAGIQIELAKLEG